MPEAAASQPVIWRRLGRRELVVTALTAGQFGVILPALAAAFQLLSNTFSNERDFEDATRLLPDSASGWELALVALALAAWALSSVGSLVSFAGFSVARDGDRLRIRRGLFQRSDAVVPIRRIHAVRVVEGVLRRPFGLATLRLEVAGYAEEASAARTLYPLLPRREVAAFLAELLPELADEPDGLTAPPPRAARRYVLPPAVAGAGRGRRRLPARPERRAVAAAGRAAARAQRLVELPGRRLAPARRPARDALAPPRPHHAPDPGGAAAGARDRAEPVPAPRRARRPRGRGRQGRPRARPPSRGAGRRRAVGAAAAMSATFYFDLGSPFVYLAAERLDGLGFGDVEWQPISLGGLFKLTGRSSWGLSPRREAGMAEIEARAARYGLAPLRWPDPWPGHYLQAMRACVAAAERDRLVPFARTALRMAFTEGRDLSRARGGARGGAAQRARPRVGAGADR